MQPIASLSGKIGMKHFLYSIWEIAEVVLIALITVFVVRNFLVQPFLVNGASMEPNFHGGDYLIIDEISYRLRQPERGEVIVFHYPNDESTYFIKRVIGLPGERIVLKDGKAKIFNNEQPQGFILDENYLSSYVSTYGDKDATLKDGEYFVLGDNRGASFDSRNWGALKKSEIIGLVRLRLWPINKVMAFEKPAY